MAIYNWFGESEHRVFNYKPRYYDPKKEKGKKDKAPGDLVKGAFRNGNYSKEKKHANKAQNIIGIIGLLLIAVVLIYIAKFYMLL